MEITRGKIPSAKKIVIYGPEGIGKSTFASQFPDPLFTDTEGSTKELDVARLPSPSSYTMLTEEIRYVLSHPGCCKTYVIDTADWAERLIVRHICDKSQKSGIEDFGYGKGYTYVQEEFGRMLNLLEEVVRSGVNVVMTAHASLRKFEQPEEMGAYDKWEMKLTRQTSPLLKEWADMILFANYKIYAVSSSEDTKKKKAQGGRRVMYTQHHPCWDAKNRYGLADELPFEYAQIAHILGENPAVEVKKPQQEEVIRVQQPSVRQSSVQQTPPPPKQETVKNPVQQSLDMPSEARTGSTRPPKQQNEEIDTSDIGKALKALREIMANYFVDDHDIQAAVSAKGYYPIDTPLENYDPGFVWGVLITAWDQVYNMIQQAKGLHHEDLPF